jgi:hypothetical protein
VLQGLIDRRDWVPGGYATFVMQGLPGQGEGGRAFEIRQREHGEGFDRAYLRLLYRVP